MRKPEITATSILNSCRASARCSLRSVLSTPGRTTITGWPSSRIGSSPPRRLVKGSFAHYLPSTSHVVFVRQGSLYAARFDLDRLEFATEPVPVLTIDSFFPVCGNANLAISARGDLEYVATAYPTRSIRWLDATTGTTELIASGRQYALPRLSNDGRYLATTVRGIFDNVWIRDLEQGTETQITRARGDNASPVWLTNNTGMVFSRNDG